MLQICFGNIRFGPLIPRLPHLLVKSAPDYSQQPTKAGRTLNDFQILNNFKTMGDHRHEDSSTYF